MAWRRRTGAIVAIAMLAALSAACQSNRRGATGRQIQALVAPAFAQHASGGVVLVARAGRPLFRRAYGQADVELGVAMRPDHVLATGSISKQFTAVAVLQLVAQGRLALSDDVRRHLPGFNSHGHTITVDQVLSHTAGLANIVDRDDFDALLRQPHTLAQLLALTADQPLHFEPGSGFRYSDSGYFLLAALIEKISGLRYRDYLETRVLRPLGLRDTWVGDDTRLLPRRARGYSLANDELIAAAPISFSVPHAAGAVFSTVDDLLRWDNALRAGRVLPAELLQRALSPRTLPDGRHSGYGYGWKLCMLAGHRTREHGGFVNGYLAQLLHLPEQDLTIIVLANNDADVPDPGALARRIARQLLTGSPQPRYHALTADQRAALIGHYRIADDDVRTIYERDGVLYSQRQDGPARELAALSPTSLTLADGDEGVVLSFELAADGRAGRVTSALRCEPADIATRR